MKFAYMIMAHNEPYILKRLIKMLDYVENDIYIHIDYKSTIIDKSKLEVEHAKLYFIESRVCTWGGSSQIDVIYDLLNAATETSHDYYHLISGVDLPLKNHSEMLAFFDENKGKEFVGIIPEWAQSDGISERYKYHYFLQNKIGKQKNIWFLISRCIVKLQAGLGIERKIEKDMMFYGGPVWFSITDQLVNYILSHEKWAKKRFKNTLCCDEIFIQTIVGNSEFKNNIYKVDSKNAYEECLRYVVFKDESPYVLEMKDYDMLLKSNSLFGRKFGTINFEQKNLVDIIYEQFK